jgi:hypothetical protein
MAYSEFIDTLNEDLKSRFGRSTYYRSVSVLVICWAESNDDGFEKEARDIGNLFGIEFKYDIEHYRIPSKNSHIEVNHKISNYLKEHSGQETLLIIHYGGHGDANDGTDELRRSIWRSYVTSIFQIGICSLVKFC